MLPDNGAKYFFSRFVLQKVNFVCGSFSTFSNSGGKRTKCKTLRYIA